MPVVPVENLDDAIKFVNERYGFPFGCIVLYWLFGSATTPLLFTSSPRTKNSRAKVTFDSSRLKTKLLTFPILHSFQRNAEWCCHSQWNCHSSWGFVIILLSNTHSSHTSLLSWWTALWRCWPKWMYVSLFDLSLHLGKRCWWISFLCHQTACIRANIVLICSHICALRWIRPAGMSICLWQDGEHSLIDHPLLFLRVDYILKFRFPPYNVGNHFPPFHPSLTPSPPLIQTPNRLTKPTQHSASWSLSLHAQPDLLLSRVRLNGGANGSFWLSPSLLLVGWRLGSRWVTWAFLLPK